MMYSVSESGTTEPSSLARSPLEVSLSFSSSSSSIETDLRLTDNCYAIVMRVRYCTVLYKLLTVLRALLSVWSYFDYAVLIVQYVPVSLCVS